MSIASHELALAEINNGERYKWRCSAARYPATEAAATFAMFATKAAREYEKEFGTPGERIFTARDILECALELLDYYARHVAESDAASAGRATPQE